MAINLGNVNISIRAFQDVSKGDHNAGEVRLTSETSIDKVNHHVSLRRLNNVSLSHEEVLAIKNAFVKALKDGGVGVDELNRVRQELGLAPRKPVDVNLHARSIRPLSRQQIREILDRNAAAINTRLGAGTIRVSNELYARVPPGDLATRRTERDVANAELDTRRNTVENRQINLVQSMLAGDVDFYSQDMRKEMLDLAKSCLDSVLAACNARPRENSMANIAMNSANGKKVVLSSGLSESAFVRKLEDIIVRLSMSNGPGDNQLAVRTAFKALETAEARVAWTTNLLNDPQGALKARVAAVMILHDRGIDDFETLSVVNHLKKNDAIAFLSNLVSGGMELEGDALRQSAPVQTALAAADAAFTAEDDGAYIPALSNQQFNAEIASNMAYAPENLPTTYQLLVNATKDMVRARFGEHGYSNKADPTWLTTGTNMAALTGAADPHAPRITPEALRDGYTNAAVNASAKRVLMAGVEARLANMEPKVSNPMTVVNALVAREPAIMTGILAAQSPEAAEAVFDGYTELFAACVRRAAACERCQAALDAQARALMASKLGVPAQSLSFDAFTSRRLMTSGYQLRDAIGAGTNGADTDAEIEAAYKSLMEKYVNERVEVLAKIDKLDLAPDAKDAFKADILKMDKVSYLDIGGIVDAAKKISSEKLANRLADKASAADIFDAMREIGTKATEATNQMFEAAVQAGKEVGPDEIANILTPMMDIIVLSRPNLESLLAPFLASGNVAGQDIYEEENVAHPAVNFMAFARQPGESADLAAKIGTDELPAFHVQALMAAVREEGLGELSAAETKELFKPGQPAGDMLKMFVETSTVSPRASSFGVFARTALRNCKVAIEAAMQNAQTVNMITEAFLSGQGAVKALEAGFARTELTQIAKTFALYKVATNATDEVALAAALDPASKASRLASYGGRFIANAENFKTGLKLMDAYATWFTTMQTNAYDKNFTTTTERFLDAGVVVAGAGRAVENFLFAEIAVNGSISLDATNPEAVFGMANNPAMRFIGRGYTTSFANSLAQIPQEKRDIIYTVFDAFDPLPKGENGAGKRDPVAQGALLAARIMKNYDAVVALRNAGHLDRAHLVPLLYSDTGVAPTATNKEIDQAYTRVLFRDPLAGLAHLMLMESGATIPEALAALHEGRRLSNAPGISSFNGHLEGIDGTAKEGRTTLVGDLIRPENAAFTANKALAVPAANVKFTFRFPDNVTLNSKTEKNGKEDVNSAAKDIADKIETLCGKVHQKQLSAVYFALTQSAVGANVNGGFLPYGITSNEHMALTFTLEKDTETGDVKIRYSEPEGFPLHFSWESTIHLDGSIETTPMVVDVPPGLEYKAIAGEDGSVPFTSGTVAPGNGQVATTMRNLIDTRCGAPENATANEKALAFQNKVDPMATKNMVYTLARVANRNLVSDAGGQKHLDFEAVNYQFNRDLLGGYKFFFPGVKGHSGDYNTNRDRLVKFVTDDANATFATASAETKRRVGVLMAFLTQNTYAIPTDSVAGAIAPPGGAVAFQPMIFGGNKPEFRLSKDEVGNIKIDVVGRDNLQGCIMIGEDDDSPVVMLREGSYSTFKMEITIPKENLESLADVDWTQYDRSVAHDYDGDLDGRIALIPEQYRFTGTVKFSYHMHLNEVQ